MLVRWCIWSLGIQLLNLLLWMVIGILTSHAPPTSGPPFDGCCNIARQLWVCALFVLKCTIITTIIATKQILGKLIRHVILGLRSRRLGIRSNSKQYYCGIHVTPRSVLNELSEEVGYKFLLGSGGSGSENRKLVRAKY
jgi:hypothetical protein